MNVQSIALVVSLVITAQGIIQGAPQGAAAAAANARVVATGPSLPADYVIGPDDVLSIVFWKDKDMSADVVVRPDGKITLPLGKEIVASGLTPDQLREAVIQEAKRFVNGDAPTANVIVKQINSRKVFITGMVEKPGPYPLTSPTTVMQLIAVAGGLREYAKMKEIVVMRTDARGVVAYTFNYEEIAKGRKLTQNILLRPGDTVVVP
jgi:polysaccharide export outer membrane protein